VFLNVLKKLRFLLAKRDKHFLFFLLFFSIVISLIEMVGISVIMPFISVASDFSLVASNEYFRYFYELFLFESPVAFIMAFGIALLVFYIFRSLINLTYFYLLAKFSHGRYHLIAFRLFENYLGLSYKDFVTKNSSYLTKNIVNEANNLTHLISAVMLIISEFFILIFIYAMMLYVNWKVTVILTLVLIVNALLLTKTVSKRIQQAGDNRAAYQKSFYEVINSSFGNFKLIKLLSNETQILQRFSDSSYSFAEANITNITLSHVPRLFLEAIGFGLIALLVTYVVWKYEQDVKTVIPMIAMFIIALYRLLPSVNRILSSYNNIAFYNKSLDIVHNELMYDIENLGNENLEFSSFIMLKNIVFGYEKEQMIFNGIDLTIKKGEKVAFIGESGSGKSTLVDMIMGLYKPIDGTVSIDGTVLSESNVKTWRKKIGYIPQQVYLFDGTVADNVAFGRAWDEEKLIQVLKKAQIWDFLSKKEGLDTRVGEGGVMLSGGQKQRIAIARALYMDPEILVLDEATSALDNDTEAKIMEALYEISQDKTLLIIAHRITTLDGCEKVYEIRNNQLHIRENHAT